jgi:U3 small nucleolar RNA-associated protein 7
MRFELVLKDKTFWVLGFISWVDVSIGKIVAQFNARHGALGLLTTNPANAIVHCGHVNGTVSLWAPTVKKPLASILCHGCPVSSMSIDNVGR